MAILQDHFYHGTIQLYTGVFGSVFNDLSIKRGSKTIKVPIGYSKKKKYDTRNKENPNPNEVRKGQNLPRMSFKLIDIKPDNSRKTNKMHRICANVEDPINISNINTQYNRVPYTFSFQLNLKTANFTDLLQLIEQILPYFDPSISITVADNEDLGLDSKIKITLLDNGLEEMYEGSFEDSEITEATMSFTLDGYLYKKTDESSIIKTIKLQYFDYINPDELLEEDIINGQ